MSRKVVAFVPDLMDRSRFAPVDADVIFVKTSDEVLLHIEGADLVVIDLDRADSLAVVAQLAQLRHLESIGFASHVDRDALEAAKVAGVTHVLARSRFFSQIVTILGK